MQYLSAVHHWISNFTAHLLYLRDGRLELFHGFPAVKSGRRM